MSRIVEVSARYGWRTPFVTTAIAISRWVRLRERLSAARLFCITKGEKGCRLQLGRDLYVTPGGMLSIGNGTYVGDRCRFEIGIEPAGSLLIGANCWLSHDCHIQALAEVRIGHDVLIGEFVSIRDTRHTSEDLSRPIKGQPDVSSSVVIEDGVWIGRGSLIQAKAPSITVGEGAIIGANSVVTKSIPRMQVWAGVPARLIRSRM